MKERADYFFLGRDLRFSTSSLPRLTCGCFCRNRAVSRLSSSAVSSIGRGGAWDTIRNVGHFGHVPRVNQTSDGVRRGRSHA